MSFGSKTEFWSHLKLEHGITAREVREELERFHRRMDREFPGAGSGKNGLSGSPSS